MRSERKWSQQVIGDCNEHCTTDLSSYLTRTSIIIIMDLKFDFSLSLDRSRLCLPQWQPSTMEGLVLFIYIELYSHWSSTQHKQKIKQMHTKLLLWMCNQKVLQLNERIRTGCINIVILYIESYIKNRSEKFALIVCVLSTLSQI